MKNILRKIADILYDVPFMSRAIMGSIMSAIETEEQGLRMLKFLEENKDKPEIMDTDYLILNKRKIIGL